MIPWQSDSEFLATWLKDLSLDTGFDQFSWYCAPGYVGSAERLCSGNATCGVVAPRRRRHRGAVEVHREGAPGGEL
eukprot:Skav223713  [mRNA]  locus=scaffold2564:61255:61644:- [translate_table: standard]